MIPRKRPPPSLSDAIRDVCWKATPFGVRDEDEAIMSYIVPAGALHRLVGEAQNAGISASLRALSVDVKEPRLDMTGN